ncbi:MAG TPA: DUF4412 domain-containing protein [Thermoanaerobaculia bacterium]|nr:DUF4412 domain-containing protein [Thermoanaerobaculia bacterium]
MRFLIRSLSVLFLFTGLSAFGQDLTIVSKATHDGSPPETTVSYISSDHIRVSQGGGNEVILDFKNGQMTTLDGKKKTYYVTTRADMDAVAAKMQEQMNSPEMKKAQEQMKNLPPEARERMNAMGGMFAVDVQDLGTTRKIAGYTCENWKMTIGQFSRTEECLTSELKFPTQAWDMYKSFQDSMKSISAAFGPMASGLGKMQEQLKKMKGYPLATASTTEVMGHRSVSTNEVTEIKRGPIPDAAWEVPAGYTKVDNPMLKSLQSRSRR